MRTAGREERKVVSVLFADLVGFTSRSDRADPEDVRDTLHLYHERVKERIEQYGGTVEKFIGDAVMAVFGAPIAHGDDAERAVRAGLRVLQAIEDLNREQPGLELAVRAAVNTGEAVVAVGPGHRSGEALAMGDVVNTASRLQTAAPPGRLIVGEATYRATRQSIRYEEAAPIDAKGKREPVQAWLAVEPVGAPAERQMTTAPMVGRDREVSLLTSIWERAVGERRPHLVTVLGPPGIGKSRLSREFSALVSGQGGRVLLGRCLPYETGDVYAAFADQVKRIAGIFEHDPPESARTKLSAVIEALLPEEAPELTRSLSLLLGLGLGLDAPIAERLLLFFAARRFVERTSVEQPAMFVFEDVHWSDGGQLDLLEYLAAHVRETSTVFLALARPELLDLRPTWGSGLVAQTTISLEPLSLREAAAIASHLLGGETASPAIDRLAEVADGNPLFVEELAAALAEGIDPDSELPTTVRAAIASRLDALPADDRAVLLDASVIGRTFWRGALLALGSRDSTDRSLDSLEARDLVRREPSSRVRGDTEFSFKHILIREVAYATLTRAERRARHAVVARYIEGVGGDQIRDLARLLAHHWREAGEDARAIDYLLLAAERAREALATDEVIELYSAALELAADDQARTRIRLLRGLALSRLEEFERANQELAELMPELDGVDLLEAILARSHATVWTEQTEETMALAEQAVELAARLDVHEMLGPAIARLSHAHGMRGQAGDLERATELGERALQLWVPDTRLPELAEHNHLMADVYYWTGDYEEALTMARAAGAHAVDPNSAEFRLRGGGMEGLTLTAMGRYEEALSLFDTSIALGRELGRPVRVPLNYSTTALRELHDLKEARRRSEEALEQQGWAGFLMPRLNSLVDLVFTDLLEGEIGRAEAGWPSVWDEVANGKGWERWLLTGKMVWARAEIALGANEPEAAAEWAHKAIGMARSVHRQKYETAARATLGRALMDMKRPVDAIAELRTAVAGADELGSPPGRWGTRGALGEALYAAGDDDGAGRAFREAAGVIREVAQGLAAERANRLLAAPQVAEIMTAGR